MVYTINLTLASLTSFAVFKIRGSRGSLYHYENYPDMMINGPQKK